MTLTGRDVDLVGRPEHLVVEDGLRARDEVEARGGQPARLGGRVDALVGLVPLDVKEAARDVDAIVGEHPALRVGGRERHVDGGRQVQQAVHVEAELPQLDDGARVVAGAASTPFVSWAQCAKSPPRSMAGQVGAREEVPQPLVGVQPPLRLAARASGAVRSARGGAPMSLGGQGARVTFGRQLEPRAIRHLARRPQLEGPLADPLAAHDVGAPAEVAPRGTDGGERPQGAELVGAPRDDVDDAQERVGAVERRDRAPDDLDLGDGLEGDELGAEPVPRGRPVGDRPAVDHDLDDAALRVEAARSCRARPRPAGCDRR